MAAVSTEESFPTSTQDPTTNSTSTEKHILRARSAGPQDQSVDELKRTNRKLRKEFEQLHVTDAELRAENMELKKLLEQQQRESLAGVSSAEVNELRLRIAELEMEIEKKNELVDLITEDRRTSIQEVTDMNQKMYRHLQAAEEEASKRREAEEETKAELRAEIDRLNSLLEQEQERSVRIDRDRAGSIKFLSNQRLKDLIEAESEFMVEIEHWKGRVTDLEAQIAELKKNSNEDDREISVAIENEEKQATEEQTGLTPGGPNEEEYLKVISRLQEQLMHSADSKRKLVVSTMQELDHLRHDLLLLGRERAAAAASNGGGSGNSSSSGNQGDGLLGWVPKLW